MLLSSATRRQQKKKRFNHTVNSLFCYIQHGLASYMVILVQYLVVLVHPVEASDKCRREMSQTGRGNEKEAEI